MGVCGRLFAGIVGSNRACCMGVSCDFRVLSVRGLGVGTIARPLGAVSSWGKKIFDSTPATCPAHRNLLELTILTPTGNLNKERSLLLSDILNYLLYTYI
jgi:hypothetical protein